MKTVMVRYTVKADRVEENEAKIKAVFAALHETKPSGLRYTSYKQDDGRSFVHIASMEGPSNPLAELPAFKAFTENIDERCEIPPAPGALTAVGSYP